MLERNLRDTDQAYLGIMGTPGFSGPGVKVDKVEPDSGAAAAGLKTGDVILQVGERPISGLMELRNALTGVQPGTNIRLLAEVDGRSKTFDVLLGNRPSLPQFSGARLQQMERMGGEISRVRDSFSRVIQTDMPSLPNQIGGPVVDLQGRVVGITIARADRTRSFLMPAAAVVELLKEKAGDPELAKARQESELTAQRTKRPGEEGEGGAPQARPRRMPQRNGEDILRQHLSEMQRLMNLMDDEIAEIEGR